jgi:hypothetical protein|tara:strand:+ start:965 stop:1192 length:228 start_codon:yes stop_codon:yes gene_type:complete
MEDNNIELSPDLSAKEYARRQSLRKKQRTPHSVNITFSDEENEEFLNKKTAFEDSVGFSVSKVQFLKSLVKNAKF